MMDTIDDFKQDIKEIQENTKPDKIVFNNLRQEIENAFADNNFDKNYYYKAETEMDARLKKKIETPPVEIKQENLEPKIYKKKSTWSQLKENFKKIVLS